MDAHFDTRNIRLTTGRLGFRPFGVAGLSSDAFTEHWRNLILQIVYPLMMPPFTADVAASIDQIEERTPTSEVFDRTTWDEPPSWTPPMVWMRV